MTPGRLRALAGKVLPAARPRVTVVVTGDEGADETVAALDAQRDVRDALEVLVVSEVADRALPHGMRLVEAVGRSPHDGRAAGLTEARAPFCVVLDAGERPRPDYLAALLAAATAPEDVVVPVGVSCPPERAAAVATERLLTARGVLLPTDLARAALADDVVTRGDVGLRVGVASRLSTAPVPAFVVIPARTTPPPTADEVGALVEAAALLDPEPADTRWAPAWDAARGALTAELGRAAAAEPALRGRILDDVAARGLRRFDAQRLNAACSRGLTVAYVYPPFLDTSGFVVARRLETGDDAYDVVTNDMTGRRPVDERSLELSRRNLGRRTQVRGRITSGHWPDVEQFCRLGMAAVERREASVGTYEWLYSRSMWASASVLAAWYKTRRPDVPWTAELSDPLAVRPNGERRENPMPPSEILDEIDAAVRARGLPGWSGDRFFDAVEWMVFALADRIVFTNENQRDLMLSLCAAPEVAERARRHSEIAPHPIPAPALYELGDVDARLPTGPVTIGYFGNFYTVRGVGDILDPFAELAADERARVRLVVYTAAYDRTVEAVAGHPAEDVVEVHEALSYFDFLATARRMDWLVLADARTPEAFPVNPYLPSKLADYRGAGVPIWGIVEEGSTLAAVDLDARSTLGDTAAALEVLRTILAQAAPEPALSSVPTERTMRRSS
ncbi:hypothetical protein ACFT5B_04275 [Luteimicrobium sp. NPDC057192]|uniref:hypothetical protein n=1 Tax=Luteimicrobium sp. NPDC057192 TaxID=3346042 RepID=UPI00363864BC